MLVKTDACAFEVVLAEKELVIAELLAPELILRTALPTEELAATEVPAAKPALETSLPAEELAAAELLAVELSVTGTIAELTDVPSEPSGSVPFVLEPPDCKAKACEWSGGPIKTPLSQAIWMP